MPRNGLSVKSKTSEYFSDFNGPHKTRKNPRYQGNDSFSPMPSCIISAEGFEWKILGIDQFFNYEELKEKHGERNFFFVSQVCMKYDKHRSRKRTIYINYVYYYLLLCVLHVMREWLLVPVGLEWVPQKSISRCHHIFSHLPCHYLANMYKIFFLLKI